LDKNSRVYVAGHQGLVGSAIVRNLAARDYSDIVCITQAELDLRDKQAVEGFFARIKPEYVFLAAARVGGIAANSAYPAEFIRDNLAIQHNIIDACYKNKVRRMLFLGSSCIYPKMAPQPIKEEDLLSGWLEPTNEAYAIAKIAGIKMCQAYNRQYSTNYISVMPTNLYGPNDNFDLNDAHVLPALIHRFYKARVIGEDEVKVWGSGTPRREFLHVDDLADACWHVMQNPNTPEILNIGSGKDITIAELAKLVKETVGYTGEIVFDTSRPDGTPRKLLDSNRITALGWEPRISLKEGIENTWRWFLEYKWPVIGPNNNGNNGGMP